MSYDKDNGPLDVRGRKIKSGDKIVIGSNKGLRFGVVEDVLISERKSYSKTWYYSYSVRVMKEDGKRQTFSHHTMGEEKFAVLT